MDILQNAYVRGQRANEAFCQRIRNKLETVSDYFDLISVEIELSTGVEHFLWQLEIYKELTRAKIQKQDKLGACQPEKQTLLKYLEDYQKIEADLHCRYAPLQQQIEDMRPNLPAVVIQNQFEAVNEEEQGLPSARIQQFEKFTADESHVGDQCVICMEDVEIGRNMMRLDCDGQHTFCQVCIEGWFADHNTCPICRHKF